MADRASEEAYEEYKKEKTSTTKRIQRSFSRRQIITIVLLIGAALYFIFILKIFQKYEGIIIIGIIIVILWLLTNKDATESKIIPMKEAMAIVRKELEYMQRETNQIPQGTLTIAPIAKLKKIEGQPTKWRVGAEIETIRFKHTQYIAEVDPFDGNMIGLYEATRGLGDIDKPDTLYIPSKELQWKRKYDLESEDFGIKNEKN